ncbi:hypothetical protein KEJ27_09770 [Candidatus Bathyarchaeota archaeon]|nr:hypothetical protein [Candidatus Bathyarchaeota archaeon]
MAGLNDEAAEQQPGDELDLTIAEAVRAPKKGELEQLIASELALAVMSREPLQKIRHTLEAYLLLPEEVRRELFTEPQRETLQILYECCVSLLHIYEKAGPDGRFAAISWSFPIEAAPRYLYWIKRGWPIPGYENYENIDDFLDKARWADREEYKRLKQQYLRALAGYLCSGDSPLGVIMQVKSEFIIHCQPIISETMRVIFTKAISSQTWRETIFIMRGRGGAREG